MSKNFDELYLRLKEVPVIIKEFKTSEEYSIRLFEIFDSMVLAKAKSMMK